MAGEWCEGRLADFADVVMGTSPPGATCSISGDGTPLLNGPTEFTDHSPIAVQFTTSPVKTCEPGDILFCVRGSTTGRMNWADRKYAIGRGLAAIRHRNGLQCQSYVRAVIEAALPSLLAVSTGSTFPSVSRSDIENVGVNIPPLKDQQAIACILGALDDKIELNRRMNRTLEAMVRAIFQSWFVDFDPVRAKLALSKAEGAAGKKPPGLKPEIAALFPDAFEQSELGEIPKGWRIGTLNDAAALVIGGDWGLSECSGSSPSPALCIRGADIPDLQSGGLGNMPTRFLKEKSLSRRSLRHGDLVIEISGGSPTQSTGRPVLITQSLLNRLDKPIVCSNFCRLFRPLSVELAAYLYLYLRWLYSAEAFLQYENGTTGIKNLAFTAICERHPVLFPTDPILDQFSSFAYPLLLAMQNRGTENATLAALRDALLPKLISGELRVPDAERIVGRYA